LAGVAAMGLQREIASELGPQEAMTQYLSLVTDSFRRSRWFPLHQTPNSVTFGTERFHTWQVATSILLFPVGLFALLGEKQHHWVNAIFLAQNGGSVIVLTGAVPGDSEIEAMLDHVEASVGSRATAA
jgi:hypothetical protein